MTQKRVVAILRYHPHYVPDDVSNNPYWKRQQRKLIARLKHQETRLLKNKWRA